MFEVKNGHSILFKGKSYLGGEMLPSEFDKYAKDFKTKLICHDDIIDGECEVISESDAVAITEEVKETPKKRGRPKKA